MSRRCPAVQLHKLLIGLLIYEHCLRRRRRRLVVDSAAAALQGPLQGAVACATAVLMPAICCSKLQV
jgi:hypothetical protein